MANIRDAMTYMHLDDQASDSVVVADANVCLRAATAYIENYISTRTDENGALWDLAVYGLTLHLYDHRGIAEEKNLSEIPFGVRTIMDSLKLTSV